MMRRYGLILLACVALSACSQAVPEQTPDWQGRFPTRVPTPTPTATPFAISAEAYYELGLERQRRGDREAAERFFTWALERDPDFAPAHVSLGSLALAEGELDKALQETEAALEIEPLAKAYVLRGEVLRYWGRSEEALKAYERAVTLDPSLWDETFSSRWQAARAEDTGEALEHLAAGFAERNAEDPLRFYYQGWASFKARRHEEAIVLLTRGVEASGAETALFWYLLGRGYVEIEAWEEAIVSLETARDMLERQDTSLEIHTGMPVPDLFTALGQAYLGAYRCGDAEAMLAYAISVGAPEAELGDDMERARICPTATPISFATATPSGQ